MPFAKVNGINLFYVTEGQGEALIFISGFSANYKLWMYQLPVFKKYFRTVVFDNRGCTGLSDKPEGHYTTRLMADDVIGLMDHLGIEKANIAGMSMGGAIAQEIAINYPQRVKKLVLVSTWAGKGEGRFTPELQKASQLPPAGMVERVTRLALNNPISKVVFVGIMMFQIRQKKLIADAGIRGHWRACLEHNAADRLPSINIPTLVVTGTKDRCVDPSYSRELADLIPGARLAEIKNGSHTFCVENRKEFNRILLEFLKS
jgi:pimeloyl-ACP methyl ester carboxylesterase